MLIRIVSLHGLLFLNGTKPEAHHFYHQAPTNIHHRMSHRVRMPTSTQQKGAIQAIPNIAIARRFHLNTNEARRKLPTLYTFAGPKDGTTGTFDTWEGTNRLGADGARRTTIVEIDTSDRLINDIRKHRLTCPHGPAVLLRFLTARSVRLGERFNCDPSCYACMTWASSNLCRELLFSRYAAPHV